MASDVAVGCACGWGAMHTIVFSGLLNHHDCDGGEEVKPSKARLAGAGNVASEGLEVEPQQYKEADHTRR